MGWVVAVFMAVRNYDRVLARTLENWEQSRAKPNAQVSLLIRLVEKFPDTIDRLAVV